MIANSLANSKWTFALYWLIATIIGWIIGFFLCMLVEDVVYSLTHLAVAGAIIGVGIGLIQSVVLASKGVKQLWWILASIVGFAIGKGIGDVLVSKVGGISGTIQAGAAIGLVVGFMQIFALENLVKGKMLVLWILVNVIAWIGGWLLIGNIADNYAPSSYLIGSLGAAIVGAITGIVLVLLFQYPRTEPST